MLRLFLVLTLVLLVIYIVWKLKHYLLDDKKSDSSQPETKHIDQKDDKPQ